MTLREARMKIRAHNETTVTRSATATLATAFKPHLRNGVLRCLPELWRPLVQTLLPGLITGIFAFSAIAASQEANSQTTNAFQRAAEADPRADPSQPIDHNINPVDVVIWSAIDGQLTSEQTIKASLRLTTRRGFTVYKKNLKFQTSGGLQLAEIEGPKTRLQYDPISRRDVEVYHQGDFTLQFEGLFPKSADELEVHVTFVGCTHSICLFPHTTTVQVPIHANPNATTVSNLPSDRQQTLAQTPVETVAKTLASRPSLPESQPTRFDIAAGNIGQTPPAESTPPGKSTPPAESTPSAPIAGSNASLGDPTETVAVADEKLAAISDEGSASSFQDRWAKKLAGGGLAFATLILVVFAGGLLSNLTPCVYPMVPITLRLLSRQASSPYIGASVYALGIVVTYSSLGLVAALGGGLFGSLLASTTFNVVFATLMILLGISMLGFGDFSKLQSLGNKLGAGKPSLRNTFFMGSGAGLVAAPCTGPILAALLAYTARSGSDVSSAVILLGTYSLGFALPYVVLGGAAAKISAIKVSPAIQVSTKLIFASVMFALGLYYLRIPFYSLLKTAAPYWAPLAGIGTTLGVALTALWLWRPGLSTAKVSTLVPTATLAMGLFATSQWLSDGSSAKAMTGLKWYTTEEAATQASKNDGKPILVDMWAEWCEACKKMDATTFVDEQIVATLGRDWVLLKLDLTEDNDANDAIQDRYELQSLPTLVLLPPGSNIKGKKSLTGYIGPEGLGQSLRDFSNRVD